MKIEINKEDLVYAVTAVEKAVSAKNTLPVLSGILITAKDNTVSFRATDLEAAMECKMAAPVSEEGCIAVPGRKLAQIAKGVSGQEIILESLGEENLIIRYAKGQIQIPCFSTEEFPVFPQASGEINGSMDQRVFRRMVKQAGIAASSDELRPVFTGMMVEIEGEDITFVSTDTHRLSLTKGKWQGEGKCAVLVPNRILQEVARLAAADDQNINITIGKSQIFFRFGTLTVATRLIVGQFPDYRQVIPAENSFCGEMYFSRQGIVESLELAAVISREVARGRGSVVTLKMKEDHINIYAASAEEGTFDEDINAQISGDMLELNYNARYMLDVLRVMEGETVRMQLTGESTPGVITEGDVEDSSFLYLILPVRVNK